MKTYFYLFFGKLTQLPYRFKTRLHDVQSEKFLRNLHENYLSAFLDKKEEENLVSVISKKISEIANQLNVLFYYFSKNLNNFPIG